ncbi:hypothetical protein C823_007368 [Eubacterium plexicaudatum ASF492]|uniref:Radical SAM core domain-containing protein n=1 Tax=Eubacterium plexicaudatum ASF492 TaxID=1235802 RepID=N2AFC2_9FIRM|nr:hypothetical protein C823_007368 [Eubacterium plexicaudatum ASF492]
MDEMLRKRILEPCLELIRKDAILRNKTEDIEAFMHKREEELVSEINSGKLIIPRITITTGPRCTLQCKDCIQLMAEYEEPYDLDIQEITADIQALFSKIDKCIGVSLVGGETFVYPYLDMLLEILIWNDKITYIEMVTNGTRIPEEKVLRQLQNPKVAVNISDYGNIVLLSKLVTKLDEYGIISYCFSDETWIDVGGYTARGRSESELSDIYLSCGNAKMCKTLMKGKLFDCARAAYLYDLDYVRNISYINVREANPEEILEYFLKTTSGACDYCDYSIPQKKYIAPAKQKNGREFKKSNYTIIARNDYAALVEAKEWWQAQCSNMQEQNIELKDWIRQLEEAKEYFLGQIAHLQNENQRLKGEL